MDTPQRERIALLTRPNNYIYSQLPNVNHAVMRSLYGNESNLRRLSERGYTLKIGQGLFTKMLIKKDQKMTTFCIIITISSKVSAKDVN